MNSSGISHVLDTIQEAIDTFSLCTKKDSICVALSGGKDSMVLLDAMHTLGYTVTGLFIDEGIYPYRKTSYEDSARFCKEKNIPLRVISFKNEFGFTMDEVVSLKKYHPCTVCGTLRRYLLNKHSMQFDKIATGHNIEDEATTIMINMCRANTDLFFRLGAKNNPQELFTQKIKPLYFLDEKELVTYIKEKNIKIDSGVCPNSAISYRWTIKHRLREEEKTNPAIKKNIVQTYNKVLEHHQEKKHKEQAQINTCKRCNQASQARLCKTCQLVEKIQKDLHK
ncbi:MAG: TIGR00269 family protein [Candidatus Woesearchaeota archaeon]